MYETQPSSGAQKTRSGQMIRGAGRRTHLYWTTFSFVALCWLMGCARQNYKADADEKVYDIIDYKWADDFGTKANYRISDTAPLAQDIEVEKAVPESGVLTLPEAVALATAHNREYQTQKEALYIKALDLRLTRHEFETQFFGGATAGYSADRNDEVIGIEPSAGFNRLLAGGTRISVTIAGAWAEALSGNVRSGLTSILSVTVTQPLLRGRDRRVVLEGLTQAERDTLYEVRSFNRFRKEFVVDVIGEYYRALKFWDRVKNARSNYNTLALVYERTEHLADTGRLPRLELDRVGQEKLQARDIYLQAEKEYEQALDEFKITLSLAPMVEFELDDSELEALKAADMTGPDFSEPEVVHAALCQRLDMANAADAVIDAQRKVFVTADGLGADLDLVVMASPIISRRADRRGVGWLNEEYGVDFELGLPLDRVAEQNVYRKALIALSQSEREYDFTADTITLDIRRAFRDLTEAAERYRVQSEGLKLAEKRFENTFMLMKYGRASSRRALRAREDMLDAQNAATDALVDFTIATLEFYRDTGTLQVRPDGMWQLGAD